MRQARQPQPMSIGDFNRRIDLQRLKDPPERGPSGEVLKKYVTYATVWASVRHVPGYEKSGTVEAVAGAVQTYLVKIRFNMSLYRTLSTAHRIAWLEGGTRQRLLDIKTIDNWNERNTEIWMQCAEVAA